MGHILPRRHAAIVLIGLALALSACLLSPGRFASALDLRNDGRFSFTYRGEIHLLALSKMAEQARKDEKFTPSPCFDDAMVRRTCSQDEIAEQKKQWEQSRATTAERRAREAEQMKTIFGGIDPASPAAAEELATRLRRQAGWNSVIYKGDGLFVVDYAISGRLDHDFIFPTIERFPLANAFVQLTRRADGSIRVDAPGFSGASGAGNPMLAIMSGAMAASEDKETASAEPTFEGTFALTTDGQVLANNTDEGPLPDAAGQRLSWALTSRSTNAPTALVRLTR